jgi:hypothetical protein
MSLAPEGLDRFLLFHTENFIHPQSVSGESHHSRSMNRNPSNGPQNIKWGFLEKGSNDDYISVIYGGHLHK